MPIKIIEEPNLHDVQVSSVVGVGIDALITSTTIPGLETKVNEFITGKTISNVTITYTYPKYIATILYAD